jgi:hypothetical protein
VKILGFWHQDMVISAAGLAAKSGGLPTKPGGALWQAKMETKPCLFNVAKPRLQQMIQAYTGIGIYVHYLLQTRTFADRVSGHLQALKISKKNSTVLKNHHICQIVP